MDVWIVYKSKYVEGDNAPQIVSVLGVFASLMKSHEHITQVRKEQPNFFYSSVLMKLQ